LKRAAVLPQLPGTMGPFSDSEKGSGVR